MAEELLRCVMWEISHNVSLSRISAFMRRLWFCWTVERCMSFRTPYLIESLLLTATSQAAVILFTRTVFGWGKIRKNGWNKTFVAVCFNFLIRLKSCMHSFLYTCAKCRCKNWRKAERKPHLTLFILDFLLIVTCGECETFMKGCVLIALKWSYIQ